MCVECYTFCMSERIHGNNSHEKFKEEAISFLKKQRADVYDLSLTGVDELETRVYADIKEALGHELSASIQFLQKTQSHIADSPNPFLRTKEGLFTHAIVSGLHHLYVRYGNVFGVHLREDAQRRQKTVLQFGERLGVHEDQVRAGTL